MKKILCSVFLFYIEGDKMDVRFSGRFCNQWITYSDTIEQICENKKGSNYIS